ncbi:MAG: hypothetical protein U1E65_11355 [Myxococcota bacterium]
MSSSAAQSKSPVPSVVRRVRPAPALRAVPRPQSDEAPSAPKSVPPTPHRIAPQPTTQPAQSIAVRSIGEARGYRRADLFGIAQIGYNYLFNGAADIARTLFEGLCAVSPREPYFFIALGLAYDQLNERELAFEAYQTATALDPRDPLPDVNAAELHIASRDFPRARSLLAQAREKAQRAGNQTLERKASSLLNHVSRIR